jgi:hypothetical protein
VQYWDSIEQEIRRIAEEFDLSVESYSNAVYALGASREPDNSGRRWVCNAWVSAQNRPRIVQGLGVGAVHDGALYCFEHLPDDSLWLAELPGTGG